MLPRDWRRCRVSEWIQRNSSLLKLALRQHLSFGEAALLVGTCSGDDESAGVNYSQLSPNGNRHTRRVLNQAANAAARSEGTIFEIVCRRSVPRLRHNQAIGAIAHRQCRLIWVILHKRVCYLEHGPAITKRTKQKRTARLIWQLRNLGCRIELPNSQRPNATQAR